MKNLFINFVSTNGVIILFDNNRKIIDKYNENILLNESTKLIGIVDKFLEKNTLDYKDIDNIVVVNGPGSFTGVRTITLVVNTINFIINKRITEFSFFDLFSNYPIIKSASRKDIFIKKYKDSQIENISNEDFLKYIDKGKIKVVYGDLINNFLSNEITILNNIDYEAFIYRIDFDEKSISSPLYIKKPSIS